MSDDTITVRLSRAEALVLFEWLAGLEANSPQPTVDEAEQRVLWSVEGQLERTLVEVVSPNYSEAVANTKRRILGG
jgi:hypothetical protein